MADSDKSGPTPPTIVARAERPNRALGAFIAQELEHWGFEVEAPYENTGTSLLFVTTGNVTLRIDLHHRPGEATRAA